MGKNKQRFGKLWEEKQLKKISSNKSVQQNQLNKFS